MNVYTESDIVGGGREKRVFGPPGTGKTTFLSNVIRSTAMVRGSDNVVAASFTTTAAAELAGRNLPIPRGQLGTLHSLAYRSIDSPPVAEERLGEWNARHPAVALTIKPGAKTNLDDGAPVEAGTGGATDGDELMAQMETYRARMVDRSLWKPSVAAFAVKWDEWKRDEGVVDFTDMIEHALDAVPRAPGNPEVGFFDEVQDFTALELRLIRKWGEGMERLVLAGDDDQCHPAGTFVTTTNRGQVPIEDLTDGDLLVSFDRDGGSEFRRRGYSWQRAERPYAGRLVTVEGADFELRMTANHYAAARWNGERSKVVYLMRRGDTWRVGTTVAHRSDNLGGVFGLAQRARAERADAAWILRGFDTEADARLYEDYICTRYGISKMVFIRPVDGRWTSLYAQDDLDQHHAGVSKHARAVECLNDHGREVAYPLWQPGARQMGMRAILRVHASNLDPEMMLLPRDGGAAKPDWVRFGRLDSEHVGTVYSLNVEPYHTYVADSIMVWNCLYRFKGATPDAFLDPPVPDEDKRVLAQSWRVPASVHRAAEHWIARVSRREQKEYLPREEEGLVRHAAVAYKEPHDLVREVVKSAETGTVMVLGACGYMLDPIKHELRRQGVPFHNPYRRSRGDWNPLAGRAGTTTSAQRLLAYLIIDERLFGEASRLWTGGDVKRWVHVLKTQGIFRRGAKTAIADLPDRELTYEEVLSLFDDETEFEQCATPSLDWFSRNLLAGARAGMEFPLAVARKNPTALLAEPQVVLGTIHSVKGGQADTVFLLPDLSLRGMVEWSKVGEPQDSVIRQFYVGMTRAKRELVVCAPSSPSSISPEQLVAGARHGSA